MHATSISNQRSSVNYSTGALRLLLRWTTSFQLLVLFSQMATMAETGVSRRGLLFLANSRDMLMQDSPKATLPGSPLPCSVPTVSSIRLPEKIGGWSRPSQPRFIDAQKIFDYMDGAGELYLGYRFRCLEVYNYSSDSQEEILVELYWMETSDDAFGLLSGDWGGEPVALANLASLPKPNSPVLPHRALYGAGLLRIWADNLYARVMAERETEASRECVLALGNAIAAGRKLPPPPALTARLPSQLSSLPRYRLRPDRICYFRSHLVLNSVYFLSSENILDLGLDVEAVTAEYALQGEAGKPPSPRILLVRYPDDHSALKALEHFLNVYLPEKKTGGSQSSATQSGSHLVEDGWLGYHRKGHFLAISFESPSGQIAESLPRQVIENLHALEATHE